MLLATLNEEEKPVGFASLNAGEYFLGEGALVCSVTGLYYDSSLWNDAGRQGRPPADAGDPAMGKGAELQPYSGARYQWHQRRGE